MMQCCHNFCLISWLFLSGSDAFLPAARAPSLHHRAAHHHHPHSLSSQRGDEGSPATALLEEDDEEQAPAGVAGAEFFGGNKQKEELYDPIAEAQADVLVLGERPEKRTYERFDDAVAFPDDIVRDVAESLQQQLNRVLYGEEQSVSSSYTYAAGGFEWASPFGSGNPLQKLQEATNFYNRVNVAIISGESLSPSSVNLRWEISVAWPIFWEPHVLITGTSTMTVNEENQITRQTDTLDRSDLISTIASQLAPRFWDTYHIGMTPSAELQPLVMEAKSLFARYKLYTLPPRLIYSPTILDTGSREDAMAQMIPNHAFSTVIKTMGPKKQRYATTSPMEVQLRRGKDEKNRLRWSLPISVELQTRSQLPLPGEDKETMPESEPEARYIYQSTRKVATLPYGGYPQDVEVAEIRKKLYEQVVRDGYKPRLDESGRPIFFFWQHDVKACYTEDGLGMAVYEYRGPRLIKSNEVGIELEVDSKVLVKK